ncbi:unnamed protein product [Camellia sinensis]
MVRLTPIHSGDHSGSMPLLAVGLFISVSALVALCAKHSRKISRKNETETFDSKVLPPKSPLRSPKQLIPFINHRKTEAEAEIGGEADVEGFGEGGLWQKAILMGEKCQPPEFSGVIYYDCVGNSISEMPRSPRRVNIGYNGDTAWDSTLPNFSFPVPKDGN